MSTLLLEIEATDEQKDLLERLLQQMKVSFRKIETNQSDTWNSLSPLVQQRIQEGLADVEAGRVKPIQEVLNRLMAK